ncbi:Por secretion system C-terminal sorting domain-containing protein [Saccharicrinis carchari]|uniref:Por secretion system C-terminal sorting domain-containing protein n=1 Tax=Saccharicrinis carchari TaxID=1168039 RepID=A0A521CCY5_SACCC|nr:T9SS type A sorting domain-containing protein [Saccharicrinis carchari]SMO57289.1 Por secretion system C-terminal sorting domain-containing protein [Saccharicrinis carchari]
MKQTLLLLAVLFSVGSIAQNLVVNGGFETWDDETTPLNWDHVENVTQETTIVHSGTYSAKHTGGIKDLGQYLPVTGGETYVVSIWYYTIEADGTDSRIWAKWADSEKTTIKDEATEDQLQGPNNGYFPTFGQWAEYSTTVAAPASAAFLYLEVRTYRDAITYWDDFSVTEDNATGMGSNNAASTLVYPNPFANSLRISDSGIVLVEVINSVGQLMSQTKGNSTDKLVIPTNNLAKGIYIVKITDAEGNIQTKKVVKK